MIKKQLTTIFLSLALAATTAFQPISISAADNLRTETKISLQDRSKKQSTKPIGYTFESKHISTSSKAKGKGATKASSVDSMTYTWDENTQTLRVSGRGKVVGNYDNRNDLAQYQNQAKKIILEKGITEIGKNAFAQFYNLSEIEFPSTLTKIGEAAFLECDKLTSATLPTSLKVLDRAAFANCSALVNVTIPSQLTTMRDYAFQRCAIKNMSPNKNRMDLLDELIDDFHVDGVVDLVLQACHTYNVETAIVKKLVKDKKGIPYTVVETDYSQADIEQINTRMAAFIEML